MRTKVAIISAILVIVRFTLIYRAFTIPKPTILDQDYQPGSNPQPIILPNGTVIPPGTPPSGQGSHPPLYLSQEEQYLLDVLLHLFGGVVLISIGIFVGINHEQNQNRVP